MKKYKLVGGKEHGTIIQTDAYINTRIYINGYLYWFDDEVDEKGYMILRWEPIKPMPS